MNINFLGMSDGVWFYNVILGARKAFDSESKSDSIVSRGDVLLIGDSDRKLLKNLIKSGDPHAKCMRFINLLLEIKAPRYWWQEFDTYKIGVERLSQSTVHTILKRNLSIDDFEKPLNVYTEEFIRDSIVSINYVKAKTDLSSVDKINEIKKILPESFLQTRTVELNFQSLRHIYLDRRNHKVNEWKVFIEFIKNTPKSEFITLEK